MRNQMSLRKLNYAYDFPSRPDEIVIDSVSMGFPLNAKSIEFKSTKRSAAPFIVAHAQNTKAFRRSIKSVYFLLFRCHERN